mgnify:CR=1 FL=1
MKKFTCLFVCLIGVLAFSQTKYLTRTGEVTFEASVPAFEEVKASNKSVTAILNTDNGEFAALVFVKGFRFKNALMEEHFNENYAESDTYPKATFKGKIKDFDWDKISNESTVVSFSGTLDFHGQTKYLENLSLTMSKNEINSLVLMGNFDVNVDDFDIKIPKIVSNKVSKTVNVDFNFVLNKK